MTVDEIFTELSTRMLKGMMTHEQLSNYYKFLGLNGYAKCHEYHFMKETCNYRKLQRYYLSHYNQLVQESEFDNPSVIPESWYNYTRQDVDPSTKKTAVKNGLTLWVSWEEETKKLYESLYKELCELGEIASANLLIDYITDVTQEVKDAQGYLINKISTGFDMTDIVQEQSKKHKKYKNLINEIVETF